MSRVPITFLGQCHISGHPGVPADAAFRTCAGAYFRPTLAGHSMWGHLLADTLLRDSLV